MRRDDQFDPDKFREDLREQIHDNIRNGIRRRIGRRPDHRPGLFPGVLLVVFGTLVLLDHMGVFPIYRLWRLWPLLLVVAGAVRFLECPTTRVFSALLTLAGTLLLLGNLGYVRLSWGELWPMILIALGLAMIMGRMAIPKMPSTGPGDPNTVTASTMFGGVERRITTSNFTGGTVTATFGGVELDFRAADIEGEEAVLYVEAIFGGIEIVVPERWMVIYEGQSIFGGYSDETRPPLPEVPGAPAKKRLILRGQAMFGGITVKN